MLIETKSDLRTGGPALSRRRTVAARRRHSPSCRLSAQPYQSLEPCDRHDIEIMEVLADILACVFAEAQEAGKINLPSGSPVADATTVQKRELLATR
jgi:hypothetical protein